MAATATAMCFWSLTREPEPSYKRRRLSEWVALYGNYPAFKSPALKREPAQAIHQIGTNALPSLLTWIAYEPSPWRKKAQGLFGKLPSWIARSRPVTALLSYGDATARSQNAMQAFEVLGPLAAPAIPELTRRISLTNSPDARNRALAALAHLGAQAVPIMARVLSNPADAKSMWVLFCVEAMGTNAQPLLPILVKNLQHPDCELAEDNAYILGSLKLDAPLIVPALIACLQDPRRDLRMEAPYALSKFGNLARQALPALTNALCDPDPDVRRNAASAIAAIAPETPNIETQPD
ncbi:MAG TPA: HEAT repeat domain-containing protein [Candidatus Acidoferrum sp.]|nr:HEAT repeat domain-containing protein [Candidatus Acidoferrum sp.]